MTFRLIFVNDAAEGLPLFSGDGGLAAASAVVSALRGEAAQSGRGCLFAVSANVAWADPLVGSTKGQRGVDILNKMQPDMVVLGERQFVHGRERLEQLITGSSTQCWLAANVYPEGQPSKLLQGCQSSRVFELQCGGRAVRVGVVGVCETLGRCCGVDVGDSVVALRRATLAMLSAGPVDVVVALTTLPFATVTTQVPEVDIAIGGSARRPRPEDAQSVGYVEVTLSPFGRPQVAWGMRSTRSLVPDPTPLDALVDVLSQVELSQPSTRGYAGSGMLMPVALIAQLLPGLFPQIVVPLTGTLSVLSLLWNQYRRSRARRAASV